ncbi:MAG: PAS domain-containing protein, partial [Spirochaetales bacterium]|nr:PAS domain-containing protein [Spirochaetales bacterium]
MRKFLERAMEKVPRMNEESIRGLLRVLADENERLDAVLDSMMDGIVVCDEDHVPILVNKSAERLLPLSQLELFESP